jgi:hypothetical protein
VAVNGGKGFRVQPPPFLVRQLVARLARSLAGSEDFVALFVLLFGGLSFHRGNYDMFPPPLQYFGFTLPY